jgi:hypothetical protein
MRYVDGHHIHHWADGGATKLSNLAQTAATRWHGERMDYGIAIDSLLYRTRRSAPVAPPPPQP